MGETCQKCQQRPATVNWVENGGVMDYIHGMYQRWCEHCATTAQLEHARKMAALVPELEAKLASLEA